MQRCGRWKYWGIQPCSDMTGGSTDQAKSGVDAWLHIDMHGPLRVQQPLCHPDKRSQHIRRGLSHHQDLARWVEPMQLQMRTCTIDVVGWCRSIQKAVLLHMSSAHMLPSTAEKPKDNAVQSHKMILLQQSSMPTQRLQSVVPADLRFAAPSTV